MHFDRMAYGERIKRLRTGRELTQEQLAEKINVSRTYIVKIENGLQIGPIEIAIELAMFFDVSMDFLLLGKENYYFAVQMWQQRWDIPIHAKPSATIPGVERNVP